MRSQNWRISSAIRTEHIFEHRCFDNLSNRSGPKVRRWVVDVLIQVDAQHPHSVLDESFDYTVRHSHLQSDRNRLLNSNSEATRLPQPYAMPQPSPPA